MALGLCFCVCVFVTVVHIMLKGVPVTFASTDRLLPVN